MAPYSASMGALVMSRRLRRHRAPVILARQLAHHALFLASPTSAPTKGTTLVSDFGYLARPALGSLDFAAQG
jgi:hypothetical protein